MNKVVVNQMLKYAAELDANGLVRIGDTISVKTDAGMYITSETKPMSELTEADVIFVDKKGTLTENQALHLAIYAGRADVSSIVVNHAPYCVGVAKYVKKLPAVLDDMAQIIGPSAKVSPSAKATDILHTLNGRNACLIKNGGVVSTGRTPDEAYTGSMVLEKGAVAYVGSTVLGNSVKIGLFDALLMRFVYKTKYSKKDQTAKQAEIKG